MDEVVVGYNHQLPPLDLAGFIPPALSTMLYFYKETEKALIFTTGKIGVKKEKTLATGKKVMVNVQTDDVRFAMVAKNDQDWGTYKAAQEEPALVCSDAKVQLEDGNLADNLYWATVK